MPKRWTQINVSLRWKDIVDSKAHHTILLRSGRAQISGSRLSIWWVLWGVSAFGIVLVSEQIRTDHRQERDRWAINLFLLAWLASHLG